MIERSIERFDCDSAYGSAEMLNWLVHAVGSSPASYERVGVSVVRQALGAAARSAPEASAK
jgi:hypothetical protein